MVLYEQDDTAISLNGGSQAQTPQSNVISISSKSSKDKNGSQGRIIEIARCDLLYVSSRKSAPLTPVETCELQPILIIRDISGRLFDDDDDSPDNPVFNGTAKIFYRWLRGPSRAVCTFHPSQIATMQCTSTLRCFCSRECFLRGFQQLHLFYQSRGVIQIPPHSNSHTYGVPCRTFNWDDPDSIKDRDDIHFGLLLHTGLIASTDMDEEWVEISCSRNYIPTREDVGHELRLETLLVLKEDYINAKNELNSLNAISYQSLENGDRELISGNNFDASNLQQNLIHEKQLLNPWNIVQRNSQNFYCLTTSCCVPCLPPPPPRNLTVLPTYTVNERSLSHHRFRVLSWNILAEIYSTQEAFPHCDAYILSWDYRKNRIIAEILTCNADIVCLQEIQTEHFDDFFKPVLKRYGYEGVYKQKTTEIFTSGSGKRKDGRYTMDGCATFYKTDKFTAKENYSLEFSALIKEATNRTLPPEVKNNPAALKRLLKDNVAVVVLLEYIESRKDMSSIKVGSSPNWSDVHGSRYHVIIANTHIVANPEANDVKIWQAQTLSAVLEEYLHEYCQRFPIVPGLVICGDFNSTPKSAVYRLLATGTCERSHEDLTTDRYGLLGDLPLGHSIRLRSAYAMSKAIMNGHNIHNLPRSMGMFEPLFTNYTSNYIGCLDYVFYTDEQLRLTSVLDLLDEEDLMREALSLQLLDCALPNPQRPSDHLALMTEFEWISHI